LVATFTFALSGYTSRALAIYGPSAGGLGADLVSVDLASDEQADGETTDAAISADGRYVVFQTRAANLFESDGESESERAEAEPPGTTREGGIFRYDRLTGQLQLVASGNLIESEGKNARTVLVRGAANLSVSAEGRYVAFSSAERLIPQRAPATCQRQQASVQVCTHEKNVQVYVRDMERRPGEAGAYKLVSAASGSEEPAQFAPPSSPLPSGNPGGEVWPHSSISISGEPGNPDVDVVFHTEAESNLLDNNAVSTPAHQLLVRDLQSNTTTLVSSDAETGQAVRGPAGLPGPALGPASISADGSTVSWVSTDAPSQTRFLGWEHATTEEPYYLWRRWREPGALIRRITGIVDLDDPACTAARQEEDLPDLPGATGPCYGPLTEPESRQSSISRAAPALSADGYTVAFLASTGLRPRDLSKPNRLDVFETSMLPGVSRKAGTSQLTLAANGSGGRSLGTIESVAISPDGSTVAFTSSRDLFVLSEPAPIGTFSPQPTESELYVIHLRADTLERALLAYGGGEPDGPVEGLPTLTADGSTLAFVAGAPNLFEGDAHNLGFLDAFTASFQTPSGIAPPPPGVNSIPGGFLLAGTVSPELGVRVRRGRSGEAILLVETPGPGTITARASGTVVTGAKASRRRSKRISTRRKKATVELARASASAPAEGTTTLVLRVLPKYAKDLASAGRLRAAVGVVFTSSATGETLSSEAPVTFYAAKGKRAPKRKPARHGSGRG
jgi:Tol biopolymer transport system component